MTAKNYVPKSVLHVQSLLCVHVLAILSSFFIVDRFRSFFNTQSELRSPQSMGHTLYLRYWRYKNQDGKKHSTARRDIKCKTTVPRGCFVKILQSSSEFIVETV